MCSQYRRLVFNRLYSIPFFRKQSHCKLHCDLMAASESNYFSKNVILLRFEDCQRSNGSVLIPTTIEIARIRRPDTGQYRPNVQFSTNMSEQVVKQTLQNSFPTFNLNEG